MYIVCTVLISVKENSISITEGILHAGKNKCN
jgi:hypothetical protein